MSEELRKEVEVLVGVVRRAIELIGDDHLEDHVYCNQYPVYKQGYAAADNFDPDNLPPLEKRNLWELCQEIEYFGDDKCIRAGRPNFPSKEMVSIMAEYGMKMKMYAGEQDSFGWLSGCLDFHLDGKNLPTIVYG